MQNKENLSAEECYKLGSTALSIDEISEFGISLIIHSGKLGFNSKKINRDLLLYKKKYYEIIGKDFDKSENDLEKNID